MSGGWGDLCQNPIELGLDDYISGSKELHAGERVFDMLVLGLPNRNSLRGAQLTDYLVCFRLSLKSIMLSSMVCSKSAIFLNESRALSLVVRDFVLGHSGRQVPVCM